MRRFESCTLLHFNMTYLIQNALFGDESGYDSFVSAIKAPIITIPYVFWEYTFALLKA